MNNAQFIMDKYIKTTTAKREGKKIRASLMINDIVDAILYILNKPSL